MNDNLVNRQYKDTVFRMLFSGKEELLELYNAVNGTSYNNVDDLEIRTLENAVYMNVKNDVAFIFRFQLYLYEHQSTVNPNMPLRDLFYMSDMLKGMTMKKNIYGSKKILIPEPKFVVFYNGIQEMPDECFFSLSDLYELPSDDPDLDLRVRMLNINRNRNLKIVNTCKRLKDYTIFIDTIRENLKTMELDAAVDDAVQECIRNNVLKDFLQKNRTEVIAMCLYEYDEEEHMKMEREEWYEIGHSEGLAEGLEQGRAEGLEQGRAEGFARAEAAEKRVAELEALLALK